MPLRQGYEIVCIMNTCYSKENIHQEAPLSISFQILIAEFLCDVQRNRVLKKSSLSKYSVAFFIFFSSEALITNISKCVSTYIKIYHKQMSFEGSRASPDRPPSIPTRVGGKKAKLLVIFHIFILPVFCFVACLTN